MAETNDSLFGNDLAPVDFTAVIEQSLAHQGLASLPWTQKQRQHLLSSIDQLAHALLIDGAEGSGKLNLAQHLINHWLLTGNTDSDAIANSMNRQHPDLHIITSPNAFHKKLSPWLQNHALTYLTETQLGAKKPSQIIGIDQIRQFASNIQLHALRAPYKIVLIYPVDKLNVYAANALLKTLEEPAGDTKLILLADSLSNVPETIRSRCMRVSIANPEFKEAHEWLKTNNPDLNEESIALILKLVHNAPLLAKQMLDTNIIDILETFLTDLHLLVSNEKNPLAMAGQWISSINKSTFDVSLIYRWLSILFHDVYKRGIASCHNDANGNVDEAEVSSKYVILQQAMMNKYKLMDKEMAYDSYFKLYKNALNGMRLSRSAIDQTLYLEQLLIQAYKLNT